MKKTMNKNMNKETSNTLNKFPKKAAVKIATITLASILCVGGVGTCLYSLNSKAAENASISSTFDEYVEKLDAAKDKDSLLADSIYIITNTDGSVKKILNSSITSNITADDIPVTIKMSYTLDGSPIEASELKGKSGKVTIRFDYENNNYETVEIGGKKEKIYVPITMISGMILSDDNFSNIEIVNGKLIDDGNRTIVIGLALPGIKDNLTLSEDSKINIPDYVEVTADVTDFSLDMTMSLATNELLAGNEYGDIVSADDLTDTLDSLSDAADQLIQGSTDLYSGLETLNEKVGNLSDGVNTLNEGAQVLASGASELSNGASQLSSGANELSSGLATLNANSSALNSGATDVFNVLLQTASNQLKSSGFNYDLTIDNYNQIIDSIIASLDESSVYSQALAKVTEGINAKADQISAGVTAQVRTGVEANVTTQVKEVVTAQVRANVLSQMGLTEDILASADEDTLAQINAAIESNVNTQMQSDEVKAQINSNVDAYMASDEGIALVNSNIAAYKQQLIDENMNSSEVQNALANASSGISTLTTLKASLNSYNQFYVGLQTYTAGVASAASGASTLASGASTLSSGASTLSNGCAALYEGTTELNNNMPALTEGVNELCEGSKALSDGLSEVKSSILESLGGTSADDLGNLIDRINATLDAASRNTVTNDEGEEIVIRYIFRSDAI